MAHEIKIKLEFVVETELNIAEVRAGLKRIPDTRLPAIVQNLADGEKPADLKLYSASYNTRCGRKPQP